MLDQHSVHWPPFPAPSVAWLTWNWLGNLGLPPGLHLPPLPPGQDYRYGHYTWQEKRTAWRTVRSRPAGFSTEILGFSLTVSSHLEGSDS